MTLVCSQKKTCAENGNGCQVKGPGGGSLLPPSGCQLAPTGPSPRLPDRALRPAGRAAGARAALPRHGLRSRPGSSLPLPGAAQLFPGLHVQQSLPLLPPEPGRRAQGPATEEPGAGTRSRPFLRGDGPDALPGVWATNARRLTPPFWRLGCVFVAPSPRQEQNDEFPTPGSKAAWTPLVTVRSRPGSDPGLALAVVDKRNQGRCALQSERNPGPPRPPGALGPAPLGAFGQVLGPFGKQGREGPFLDFPESLRRGPHALGSAGSSSGTRRQRGTGAWVRPAAPPGASQRKAHCVQPGRARASERPARGAPERLRGQGPLG